ncbi:hypothetical protein FSARC_6472 [Fusarium sarcochroum]|uniref:R3H domain-containing protein n=1 Tax=Fusarium sarcochroum TaxID=1208366 RepID=A0A8H4TXN2_9HYPO|nr:hypothetical protein FSARC_6472 [Fusarium sarcochroum]
MVEQESGQASNQAQNHAQNRPQNEGQGSASGSRGGSRGGRRRGRGGRNRGQRQDGSAQDSRGRGNASSQTDSANPAVATPSTSAPTEPAASAAPESSGASRGRRNRRGNRGGARGSGDQGRGTFSVGPRRQFGGRLTTTQESTETATQDPSLSANAPEFVPGQPVSQRSAPQQPSAASQSAAQPRSRGTRNRNRKQDRPRQEVPKSTASELWQRIQEDIANWNYECRVCTEEVTRKTEAWSCTTCWTVVHLECAHQWWDTSMKVNEETGDRSWRCPGCNSILNDEPGDYKFARTPVEELMTAVLTTVKRPVTHKMSFQLIVLSPQMLSLIVPVEKPHLRTSWTTHASLARSRFRIARGFARRSCNVVIFASLCAISEIVIHVPKPRKSTVVAVGLQLRRYVMKGTSRTHCALEYVRQPGIAADIDAESIVAQVRRKHLSDLPSRRNSALVPNHFPSKPSISVFSPVGDHSSVAVTFASNSATAELAKAALRLYGPKSAATAARRSFILLNPVALASRPVQTSVSDRLLADIPLLIISVILMTRTAVRFADRGSHAGFTRVGSFVIAPENAAMLKTANVCHGQTPCNESTACQVKMSISCPCGNYRKEFKCLASTSNPAPSRPELRCDEECERLDRNRRLAAALNIDPASHTNDHIPFSDNTLKLYKKLTSWGDAQESQYRVFAANPDEVRLRYEPMRNESRQFLHLLAEDFGFESKSEDYDIHRSVVVWKTEKFVSAPAKTLAQCVKIRAAQAAEVAVTAAIRPPSPPVLETEPFNALVLTEPRFGLTIDEVNNALTPDLSSLQGFSFKVDFLNEEVLIKATAAYSAFLTPAPMEKSLGILKPRLEQTIRREKLAESVLLCHSDLNGAVTRREILRRSGAGGWSAVAGRAASRPTSSSSTPAPEETKPGRRLLLGLKKKKPQQPEAGKVWAALDGDVEC